MEEFMLYTSTAAVTRIAEEAKGLNLRSYDRLIVLLSTLPAIVRCSNSHLRPPTRVSRSLFVLIAQPTIELAHDLSHLDTCVTGRCIRAQISVAIEERQITPDRIGIDSRRAVTEFSFILVTIAAAATTE